MLPHQNNNLLGGQSQGNFQHLLHRIEHPNLDFQILTFLKNLLISIESTQQKLVMGSMLSSLNAIINHLL